MEIKKKLCFIYLCLCVGLTACGTTITEGRSGSAVPETELNISEEDVLAEPPEETISREDEADLEKTDNEYARSIVSELIEQVNYSSRIYSINAYLYDAKVEQEYKEAFYKVITSEIPVEYQDDRAVFFRDYLRTEDRFDDNVVFAATIKTLQYLFLDYDGDGLPELAVDCGPAGPCILKYIPEEECVIIYDMPGSYQWVILGSGQMGYHTDYSGEPDTYVVEYRYVTKDKQGGIEQDICFYTYYTRDLTGNWEESCHEISMLKSDNYVTAVFDKEQWEEITREFFEAMEHPVAMISFDEAFGEDFAVSGNQSGNLDETITIYEEFLSGEGSAENIDIEAIADLSQNGDVKYAIYDVSGDDIPELHIQTDSYYYIFTYRNDRLFILTRFAAGDYDITEEGEIVHRNIAMTQEVYEVYSFMSSAHVDIMRLIRTDYDKNGIYDENDEYQYSYNVYFYSDRTCTLKEWQDMAGEYLYEGADGTLQVRDAVEWTNMVTNIGDTTDIVYAKEAEESAYRILTKRYVRWPNGCFVLIEWPKITGAGNQQIYDNINYILERDVFRIVDYFILYPEESGHVLQRIANMKDQDLTISYEVLYQDDQILCIYIREQSTYYWEDGGFWAYGDEDYYYVFDINTGKQLELADFIEIDRRIVDYVAEDYQPTKYISAINEPSYSFMDAFEVYEDEKYERHEVMNVEEALEALKDGTIQWYIVDDKILVLQWGDYKCTFQDMAWVKIPYSYIEEFAYY